MMQLFRETRSNGATRFRAVIPLVAPDAKMIWGHVAYAGMWKGYIGKNGPETVQLTREMFDQMIANFERQVNPKPMYMDHTPGLSYAWLHKLRRDGDQLYARIELTEDARDWVAQGKMKYTSIAWDDNALDRVTGEEIGAEIVEISLTNDPFLDGQQPLQLSRASDRRRNRRAESMPDKQFANAKEAAQKAIEQLDDKASREQLLAAIEAQMKLDEAVEGKSSGGGEETGSGEMSNGEPDTTMQEPGAEPGAEGEDQTAVGAELLSMLMGEIDMEPAALLAAVRDNIGAIAEAIRAGAEGDGTPADQGASQPTGDAAMSQADKTELTALRRRVDEQNKKLSSLQKESEQRREAEINAEIKALSLAKADEEHVRALFRSGDDKRARELGRRLSVPAGDFAGPERKPASDPENPTFEDLDEREARQARMLMGAGYSRNKAAKKIFAKRGARAN